MYHGVEDAIIYMLVLGDSKGNVQLRHMCIQVIFLSFLLTFLQHEDKL